MGSRSGIEWTHASWNPLTGCTKYSAGCANCYAEVMARRLRAMGQSNYQRGFELTLHEHRLDLPLRWRRPRLVFVDSMSDLFHDGVPVPFIEAVFATMVHADQHRYQVLTKRAARLAELAPRLPWPSHTWAGVTVERNDYAARVDDLRPTPFGRLAESMKRSHERRLEHAGRGRVGSWRGHSVKMVLRSTRSCCARPARSTSTTRCAPATSCSTRVC